MRRWRRFASRDEEFFGKNYLALGLVLLITVCTSSYRYKTDNTANQTKCYHILRLYRNASYDKLMSIQILIWREDLNYPWSNTFPTRSTFYKVNARLQPIFILLKNRNISLWNGFIPYHATNLLLSNGEESRRFLGADRFLSVRGPYYVIQLHVNSVTLCGVVEKVDNWEFFPGICRPDRAFWYLADALSPNI